MDYVGIDVHTKQSQICLITEAGEVLHQRQCLADARRGAARLESPGAVSAGIFLPVVSCYEAGRDCFWLHRFPQAHGIINAVVESSAIEVNRRKRRAKSDGVEDDRLSDASQTAGEESRNIIRQAQVRDRSTARPDLGPAPPPRATRIISPYTEVLVGAAMQDRADVRCQGRTVPLPRHAGARVVQARTIRLPGVEVRRESTAPFYPANTR